MKSLRICNLVLLLLSAGLIVCLALFFSSSSDHSQAEDNQPYTLAMTVSMPIPDKVTFCGEEISLLRLDMRERFDREINAFTYLHSSTSIMIKRANRYFPIIEPILKKHGIPDDFKYLCLIESNLDTRALSTAKAAGLWQFMETTGKEYGLEIRTGVDERYHIEKATEAACHYLKSAYGQFGDWVNVAASYNAGKGRISSNIASQYVDSAFDMLLVSETSRYVFRILAIKELMAAPYKYGFVLKKENLYPQVRCDYVEVRSSISDLAWFAKEQGIDYKTLKDYNVWLRDTQLTVPAGKSYQIAIPRKEDLSFDLKKVQVHDKAWVRHH